MKTLELNQMENLEGGEYNGCTKTSTKILMGIAAAAVGAATGGIGLLFGGWAFYQAMEAGTSGECENW